jgi:ribonuclease HI
MRKVNIWTDGGCKKLADKCNQQTIGAGIVAECDGHRKEWAVPLGVGTNQQAELLAVYEALGLLQDRANLHVIITTDSQYVQGVLTQNWAAVANLPIIDACMRRMAAFGKVEIKWVKGHDKDANNCRADHLAGIASGKIKGKQ